MKGLTALHPLIPAELRGTYLGLASPPVIEHLRTSRRHGGRTDAGALPRRRAGAGRAAGSPTTGATTRSPSSRRTRGSPRRAIRATPSREFKTMVRTLHAAGLEVILDVVYNHTAEGDHRGPTLSFRGIDNASYYRLQPGRPSRYQDFTGCGNTLEHAVAARAAAHDGQPALLGRGDARRRLPLRPGLGARARTARGRSPVVVLRRHAAGSDRLARQADRRTVGRRRRADTRSATSRPAGPSGTASTATPCGGSGAATPDMLPELATRLAGSSDLYGSTGRKPHASINFVTAHDGFTLADLVSYERQAQRGQRRGQPRRRIAQPELELRRRGPDRRSGNRWNCAAASVAISCSRCWCRKACR